MIGLIYAGAAITFIVVGIAYRIRRDPEHRLYWTSMGIALSVAVLVGTWIAGGFA